jgi:Uma2 family endonuclease
MVREPAAPLWPHQEVVTRTTVLLFEHVETRGLGTVNASPVDVVLDKDRGLVLQPDIVYVSNDRMRLVHDQVWGPPDLVVEVESRGTRQRDRIWKRRWYGDYGVREYWLIDAEARTVTVFAFGESGAAARRTFTGETSVRSTVLPEFGAPAARFFPASR